MKWSVVRVTHDILPHRTEAIEPRRGQLEAVEALLHAAKSDHDAIELVARPGAGKTLVALVFLLNAIDGGLAKRAAYIVHTVALVKQVAMRYGCGDYCVGDPPLRIKPLLGMRNFMCPVHNTTVDKAPCNKYSTRDRIVKFLCYMGPTSAWAPPAGHYEELWKSISKRSVYAFVPPVGEVRCPYGEQFIAAKDADVLVMTESMLERLYVTGILPELDIIVMDESQHTFFKLASQYVEVDVPAVLNEAIRAAKRLGDKEPLQRFKELKMMYKKEPEVVVAELLAHYRSRNFQDAPESLISLERLYKVALGRVKHKKACGRKESVCTRLVYYVDKLDLKSALGVKTVLLMSAPPPFGEQILKSFGFKQPVVVEWEVQIPRPIKVVYHPRAVSVSSLRLHMHEEYRKMALQVALYAKAKSKELIIVSYSRNIYEKDGVIWELRADYKSVDAWAGIDITKPVDMVIFRAPFPHLGVPAVAERPDVSTVLALRKALNMLRGARTEGDRPVHVYTADLMLVKLLQEASKYFKSITFEQMPEDATIVVKCNGVVKELKLMEATLDELKSVYNSMCNIEAK